MTFCSMLRRFGACSSLVLSAVALTGCPDGGGGSSGILTQQAYVKASNTSANDFFGMSVALDGDTMVVGSWFEDSNATGVNGNQADNTAPNSGAVYVFTRANGVWSQEAYLKASNTEAGDNFGKSVALSGNTLAVGAWQEGSALAGVTAGSPDETTTSNGALGSGAVYVFTRTNGVWSQQAYLKASNTGASDGFGNSVALDGDTLVVGANEEQSNATGVNGNQADNTAPNSGAVYVFTRANGVWSQEAYLKASNTEAGDNFGISLALSGNTLAVGAYTEDSLLTGVTAGTPNEAATLNAAPNSGAVYVFTRANGVWSQQAYLKASNTGAGDSFGINLALGGDTLIVGANNEDSNATGVNGNQVDNTAPNSGAVYVFVRTNGVWGQQTYLKASNTEAGDRFGTSVALSGDTLVVGASDEGSALTGVVASSPNETTTSNGALGSGAVYRFTHTNGVWSQSHYVKAANTGTSDNFGISLALSSNTLAVGAWQEGSAFTGVTTGSPNEATTGSLAPASGAVYLFAPQ
ncbi:MAG: FG-GAP repeat protein [Nitrospira sp.]